MKIMDWSGNILADIGKPINFQSNDKRLAIGYVAPKRSFKCNRRSTVLGNRHYQCHEWASKPHVEKVRWGVDYSNLDDLDKGSDYDEMFMRYASSERTFKKHFFKELAKRLKFRPLCARREFCQHNEIPFVNKPGDLCPPCKRVIQEEYQECRTGNCDCEQDDDTTKQDEYKSYRYYRKFKSAKAIRFMFRNWKYCEARYKKEKRHG